MFCNYCGKKIKEESSFCPYCGKQLHSQKENSDFDLRQNPQKSRTEYQRKQKKSRWRIKLLLWLLACTVMTIGTICTLLYFGIADIPMVREIMTEIGIIQEHNSNDGTVKDSNEQEPTAGTTTIEEETTHPTTEDPEEAAYWEAVDYCAALAEQGDFDSAITYLEKMILQTSDSRYTDLCEEYTAMQKQSIFAVASGYASDGKYRQAIQSLDAAWANYADEDYYEAIVEYRQQFGIYNTSLFAVGKYNTILLGSDGRVEICGEKVHGEYDAVDWTNIVAVSAGDRHVVGLTKNGTVVAEGNNVNDECEVTGWTNIIAISAGDVHTVALSRNGIVQATGYNTNGQCDEEKLMRDAGQKRIVAIAAGNVHTLALLEDGRVVGCGGNSYGERNVNGWVDIVAIYAGSQFSAGLKKDGTVVVTGKGTSTWDLSDWTDIVNLAAGDYYLIGLKANGEVLSACVNSSNPPEGQANVSDLRDIVFVGAGHDHTVAMNSDGVLFCIGSDKYGQCEFDGRVLN